MKIVNENNTDRKKYIITKIICATLLAGVLAYGIKPIMQVHIAADEFGYWTSAAFFCGYDWSNCASLNKYYGWGYGLVLAPILALFDGKVVYIIAVATNIAFIVISFLIYCAALVKISGMKRTQDIWIVFAANCYSSVIFYTKLTLVECLLWLLFSIIIYLLVLFCEKPRFLYAILIIVSSLFMVFCHMRTICILPCALLCIFFRWVTESKVSRRWPRSTFQFVMLIILAILGIFLLKSLKDRLIFAQYSSRSEASGNELSAQVSKIAYMFSIPGMRGLITLVLGRLWYHISSTFLVLGFGIIYVAKSFIAAVKKKSRFSYLPVFCFMSFCCAVLISAIFWNAGLDGMRRDALVYGRYSDYVVAPLIMMGIWELCNRITASSFACLAVMNSICSKWIWLCLKKNNMLGILDVSIPALYGFIEKYQFDNKSFVIFGMVCTLWACVIFVMKKTKRGRVLVCLLFAILSIYFGYSSFSVSDTHKHDQAYNETYLAIEQHIDADKQIVYCYNSEDLEKEYYHMGISIIQVPLKNKRIEFVNVEEKNLPQNAVFVLRKDSKVNELMSDYSVLADNKEFVVYE